MSNSGQKLSWRLSLVLIAVCGAVVAGVMWAGHRAFDILLTLPRLRTVLNVVHATNDAVLREAVSGIFSLIFLGMLGEALGSLYYRISSPRRSSGKLTAPLNAQFLFYLFMTPQNCDALVGDLEERYRLIHRKFGRRRADLWYWVQVFISLRPIMWAALNEASGLVVLVEAYRRRSG